MFSEFDLDATICPYCGYDPNTFKNTISTLEELLDYNPPNITENMRDHYLLDCHVIGICEDCKSVHFQKDLHSVMGTRPDGLMYLKISCTDCQKEDLEPF